MKKLLTIFLGCFLDWQKAAKIVVERANQDKRRLLNDNEVDGYQPIFNDNDEVEEESTTIEFMRIWEKGVLFMCMCVRALVKQYHTHGMHF